MLVIDMLICAATASAEIRALWRDAIRGTLLNFDQICFGVLLLFPDDFCGNRFAFDRVGNKDGLALLPRHAFSPERDVLNFQIDNAHVLSNIRISATDSSFDRSGI